jgi:hypothetical protein
MRRSLAVVCAAGLIAVSLPAAVNPPAPAPGPPTAEELAAGQELAESLRSTPPDEDSSRQGHLRITTGGVSRSVPFRCEVKRVGPTWETDYTIDPASTQEAERLEVVHQTNGPTVYRFARAPSSGGSLPPLANVPAADLEQPLAGSDFSFSDLGLEFLHWPGQRRLKGEMRLGQPCYVLESTRPGGGEIVRIRSDIDKESGGLLIADAYDAAGSLIKEFSLHASSFKKIHGHWQVEKMEIRNKKTGSRTELKFDLKP